MRDAPAFLPPVEERINDWDPKLEARPFGKELIDATRSWRCSDETNHWDLEFSDTEEDEPGTRDEAGGGWGLVMAVGGLSSLDLEETSRCNLGLRKESI